MKLERLGAQPVDGLDGFLSAVTLFQRDEVGGGDGASCARASLRILEGLVIL